MSPAFDPQVIRSQQPVALVYPANVMAAYGILRSLGERGIQVLALSPCRHPHLQSRWATPVISPRFAEEPEVFIAFLNDLARHLPAGGVLYLLEDVFVYLLHQYRDRLASNIRFPFLDEDSLRRCLDKRSMLDAAAQAGVPIPRTVYPTSPAELEAAMPDLAFPALIKPLTSRFHFGTVDQANQVDLFPRTFGAKCLRADTPEALREAFRRAHALRIPLAVQELLEGPMDNIVGIYLYADARHDVRGRVIGRKLRQFPADFGSVTLRGGVADPVAAAHAATLVRAVGFHGIGSVEFRLDVRTGELKLMEINPRPGHGSGFGCAAGVDLPYLQYADLVGLPLPIQAQNYGVRWVDVQRDWAFFRHYRRQAESPYRLGWWTWLRSLIGTTPAVLNWRDPLPGLLRAVPGSVWRLRQRRAGHTPDPEPPSQPRPEPA